MFVNLSVVLVVVFITLKILYHFQLSTGMASDDHCL